MGGKAVVPLRGGRGGLWNLIVDPFPAAKMQTKSKPKKNIKLDQNRKSERGKR